MEIDILQLIWFVFIVVILLAGIIKRSLNRKSQERFSGNNVRRREESRDINSGKQQGKSDGKTYWILCMEMNIYRFKPKRR